MEPKAMFYNLLLEQMKWTIFGSQIIKQMKVKMKGGFFNFLNIWIAKKLNWKILIVIRFYGLLIGGKITYHKIE